MIGVEALYGLVEVCVKTEDLGLRGDMLDISLVAYNTILIPSPNSKKEDPSGRSSSWKVVILGCVMGPKVSRGLTRSYQGYR